MGYKCKGKMEKFLVGYSELSVKCIKGCVKNYRCRFGKYYFFSNNCYKFVNSFFVVLCRKGKICFVWC